MVVEPAKSANHRIRVMCAGRPLVLEDGHHQLKVFTGKGERLDKSAAEVIVALGGDEPVWLRTIEGLEVVYADLGMTEEILARAADALGRKPSVRANIARTGGDLVVLLALAGAGQPQVAGNPHCTARMWDILAGHPDEKVQQKAKEIGVTLPPCLADHREPDVQARVARNPICPPETLASLAQVENEGVQRAVAANPATDVATLTELAGRAPDTVRATVAANPHTSPGTLRQLAKSRSAAVRANVAGNRNLPPRSSTRLLWDKDGQVRYALAQREDLSPVALSWVERYARRDRQYRQTRWRLSQNAACPTRLHTRLETIRNNELLASQIAKGQIPPPPILGWRWVAGTVGVVTAAVCATTFAFLLIATIIISGPTWADLVAVAAVVGFGWLTLTIGAWRQRARLRPIKFPPPMRPVAAAIVLIRVGALVVIPVNPGWGAAIVLATIAWQVWANHHRKAK